MVRNANAAIDAGQIKKDDVPALLAALNSSMKSSPSLMTTTAQR